ncbi:MAG: hypothetical protein JXR69_02330 [Candidatus Delongbacteria bacterium]|nr:hypothetical protein [Candidatus Delongbacteria bacterium]
MELNVIRHKTSKEFFIGFYPEDLVESYAYQLERMFEQGSAVEGDYFVVSNGDIPLLSLEIFRNHTRRILEKPPLLAMNIELAPEEFTKAMTLIFEYLNDEIISGAIEKALHITISENNKYFTDYKKLITDYKFINILTKINFEAKLNEIRVQNNSECTYDQLINIPVEERFNIISKSTYKDIYANLSNEKVYLDMLEEGYQSEDIWDSVIFEGKAIGYMMPVFTNGLKNKLELINYGCYETQQNEIFYNAVLNRVIQLSEQHKISQLVLNVNTSDTGFVSLLERSGLRKSRLVKNYIRK